jgi:hypothetical protein
MHMYLNKKPNIDPEIRAAAIAALAIVAGILYMISQFG